MPQDGSRTLRQVLASVTDDAEVPQAVRGRGGRSRGQPRGASANRGLAGGVSANRGQIGGASANRGQAGAAGRERGARSICRFCGLEFAASYIKVHQRKTCRPDFMASATEVESEGEEVTQGVKRRRRGWLSESESESESESRDLSPAPRMQNRNQVTQPTTG